MNKAFFAIIVALFGLFVVTATTNAQSVECQPIYGGGQTCVQTGNIVLNKTVQNPDTQRFVENLGTNEARFSPSETVTFRLTVQNKGERAIENISVKDTLPQYLSFVEGPGRFDANTKTLTFTVDRLNADETKTYTIRARAAAADQLPGNQGVVCVVNQASATQNGNVSEDNAQLCIERQAQGQGTKPQGEQPTETKGGLKVFPPVQTQQTPPTGPETLALISLLPTAGAGYFIRKFTNKTKMNK